MSNLMQFFSSGGSEFADLSKAIENGDNTKMDDLLQHYNYQYALCMMCGNSELLSNNDFVDFIANNINTMNVISGSKTAMNAIAASQTAMNIVSVSQTAMNAVSSSETAINIVSASQTAMNAIAASETAMNIVVESETAINIVSASQTAMNAIAASQTAMKSVAASQTAMNTIFNSSTAISSIQSNSTEEIIAKALSYAAGSSTSYTTIDDCLNDSNVNSYIFSHVNTRQLFWIAEPFWTWDGATSYLGNLTNSHWLGNSTSGWHTQVSINDGKHYIAFIKFHDSDAFDWYNGIISNYDGSNSVEVNGGENETKWLKHFTTNGLITKFNDIYNSANNSSYANSYYIAVED